MVDENEVLDYLNNLSSQGQEKEKPKEKTSQSKQDDYNKLLDNISNIVAEKLSPYLHSTLGLYNHVLNYLIFKDKYGDLKPEDYIRISDEVEKELGDAKIEKIEDILNRVALKKEKFHSKFKKPEEVVKKVVTEVDVKTNSNVVSGNEPVAKVKEEKDSVQKIFEKLTKGKKFGV